ncbi:MAG: AAA domain-containing protein [Dehalococcoidia bacterium]
MTAAILAGPRADGAILAAAQELAAALGERALIAAGFSALGWPVDLAVFGEQSLAVIQRAPAEGPIVANRSGLWTDRGEPFLPDRPNPLVSLRLARLALLDRLAECSSAVLGRDGDALVWNRAGGFVAVTPRLAPGSRTTLGVAPEQCRIVGIDRVGPTLARLRPTHAPLDPSATLRLLVEGLGLRPVGEAAEDAGCFLCDLHGRHCDLHRLRGAIVGVRRRDDSVLLSVRTEDHWIAELYLNHPWQSLAEGIERLVADGASPTIVAHHLAARISDGRARFAAGGDSLVVLAPEVLLDVSAVAEMAQCPMAYVIHQFGPKDPNDTSVRGKVVHAALRRVVRGEGPAEALTEAVRESGRDLAFAGLDAAAASDAAREHVERLATFVDGRPAQTETGVSNPFLGLAGRVDAVWEDDGKVRRILELKTGRPMLTLKPRRNHLLQAQLYAASLWQAGRLDLASATAEIGYTGGDEPIALPARLDWPSVRQAIFVRNEAVLFDLTGHPLGEAQRCHPCPRFRLDRCQFYADLLGYAPRMTTDDADRVTFRRWVAALRHDAAFDARSALGAARRSVNERVEDGTCFRIDAISSATTDEDGRWHARLSGPNISRFRAADRALLVGDGVMGRQVSAEIDATSATWIDVIADAPAPWATRLEPGGSGNLLQGLFQGLTGWLRGDVRLRRLVAGDAIPSFGPRPPADPALDPFQQAAAATALAAKDYALIWGPPGSGKTRTIARIVRAAGRRVLLAAFTNQAVDNLALALLADGQSELLILGRPNRSNSALDRFTLDATGDDLDAISETLGQTPIVLSTAHQVASGRYDRAFGGSPPFGLVILDEATQLTEPAALGVLRLGAAFVLVGDHKQLAPIVADQTSDLARSLFDRLWADPASTNARAKLARQYRMRSAIAAFSAHRWYDDDLQTAPSAEARPPVIPPTSRWPALWGDSPAVLAATNDETAVVATLVAEALSAGLNADDIGVVAPYRQQVAAIAAALAALGLPDVPLVDTVDRFQGSERDCIILATGAGRQGDLLNDERRLNVALTRARRKLIVVGDPGLLRRSPASAALVDHFAATGCLVLIETG